MGLGHRITVGSRALEFFVVCSVIVVISSISFILLSGTLAEARDSQRVGDIASIRRALELYHLDHNQYPATGWVNSGDASWDEFAGLLTPYITAVPRDPLNQTEGKVEKTGAFNYTYYSPKQGTAQNEYVLVFRLEQPDQAAFRQHAVAEFETDHGTFSFEDLTGVPGIFAMRAP